MPGGEYVSDTYSSTWALGALLRAERTAGGRPWAGELAMEVVSAPSQQESGGDRPVQARIGLGPLFTLAETNTVEIRASPRFGLTYGHYDVLGFLGAWGGLALDGLWWVTPRVAASVGLDARAAWWSTLYKKFNHDADAGILVAVEGLIGVVVKL